MKVNILFLFMFSLILEGCNKTEARRAVDLTKDSELNKTIAINKRIFLEEKKRINKYIELDSTLIYINSGKGFWYAYLTKKDNSVKPVRGDNIVFEQELIGMDGTILYAKKDLGLRNYVVDKEHIIKGLKEGLKIMGENEEIKFIFSSFVAYRMNGDTSGRIGSNEPIISKIKLIKIN